MTERGDSGLGVYLWRSSSSEGGFVDCRKEAIWEEGVQMLMGQVIVRQRQSTHPGVWVTESDDAK